MAFLSYIIGGHLGTHVRKKNVVSALIFKINKLCSFSHLRESYTMFVETRNTNSFQTCFAAVLQLITLGVKIFRHILTTVHQETTQNKTNNKNEF